MNNKTQKIISKKSKKSKKTKKNKKSNTIKQKNAHKSNMIGGGFEEYVSEYFIKVLPEGVKVASIGSGNCKIEDAIIEGAIKERKNIKIHMIDPLGAKSDSVLPVGLSSAIYNWITDEFHHPETLESFGTKILEENKFDVVLLIRPYLQSDNSNFINALNYITKNKGIIYEIPIQGNPADMRETHFKYIEHTHHQNQGEIFNIYKYTNIYPPNGVINEYPYLKMDTESLKAKIQKVSQSTMVFDSKNINSFVGDYYGDNFGKNYDNPNKPKLLAYHLKMLNTILKSSEQNKLKFILTCILNKDLKLHVNDSDLINFDCYQLNIYIYLIEKYKNYTKQAYYSAYYIYRNFKVFESFKLMLPPKDSDIYNDYDIYKTLFTAFGMDDDEYTERIINLKMLPYTINLFEYVSRLYRDLKDKNTFVYFTLLAEKNQTSVTELCLQYDINIKDLFDCVVDGINENKFVFDDANGFKLHEQSN
jgi:hypothetical protein